MKNRIASLLLLPILLAFGMTSCSDSSQTAAVKKEAKYHCPMHPTYTDDRPSDCPICGMRLVAIKITGGAATNAAHESHENQVPGRVAISVSPERRQTIGLATSEVTIRTFARSVRTTALVEHDETRLARIAPRFGGWVRKLHVAFTGQQVTAGQPLFTAYSPELFTAENEYLLALQNARFLTNSTAADRQSAESLANSARRRLELLEVGDAELRDLETRGKAGDELLFRAPLSGHVITKNAVEGQSFIAGEPLYEIGDMMHLWLRASLFEYEISAVTTGAIARAVFPHLNNLSLPCTVQFIYPHIDAQTRRAEIRLNLDNTNHVVRPGMWANVELEIPLGEGLAVPASALIDSGTRRIAFVDRADGHLEPRDVKVGATADEYTQVLSGLKAGEKVVTRALFMIDSESQLKAAIAGMTTAPEHH